MEYTVYMENINKVVLNMAGSQDVINVEDEAWDELYEETFLEAK